MGMGRWNWGKLVGVMEPQGPITHLAGLGSAWLLATSAEALVKLASIA